ncbi:MAG: UbiH/UbiF/VisC/COQ6 family ubiquinone biosynthesis hydroxylase [Paracoccaceae bacterium]
MNTRTDIVIVGGGLAGPALALCLARAGLSSSVVDAQPEATMRDGGFDGRSYALALTAQRLLDAIGVWDQVEDNAQPILDIKVSDGHAGTGPSPFVLHFDHAEIEEGPMGYMVEDRYLRRALLDAVAASPLIEVRNNARVVAQDIGSSVVVTLEDGSQIEAAVLVGADGGSSGTAMRAGVKYIGWPYGQTALVCAIAHELPHQGIAQQMFMPEGPLAILPLTGNRSSIVWTERSTRAEEINALPAEDYLQVLRPRFGGFLGDIELAGDRFTYPLRISVADSFVADRVALVGDAAHKVHPIAGQGLNAGFRDIAALAEVLADARRRGEDIGSELVLGRYESWRRFDVQTLAFSTNAFNRLFSNDNPLLRIGRDLGLGITNALPSVRRTLMREAAGLTGDVPRLMRGLPL